jgi:DNA polymerase-3 subunit epsilon
LQIVAIDLETTGINPELDRIVEIAGVIFDTDANQVIGEFESLINPKRNIPLEASKIHGLTADHVSMAPTFEELAKWLEQIVNGRPLIAHNSQFDSSFLSREFKRSDVQLNLSQSICTQRLSAGMSLKDACTSLEIEIEHHHSALADARASFAIFKHFFDHGNVTLEARPSFSSAFRGNSAVTVSRSQLGIPSFARPVSSFSRPIVFPDLDSHFAYWAVLNEYLEDLEISKFEREALRGLAESLGLSADQEHSLQVDYLNSLEAASLRDGIVSQTEADTLNTFSKALGIPKTFMAHDNSTGLPESGALICVTGTAEIEGKNWNKDSWRTKLSEMGYRFTDDLKKSDNVAMLLQDSPGSQSSKVAKAMAWGIPRMSFAEFLKLTGDNK